MKRNDIRYIGVLLLVASLFVPAATAQETDIEKTLMQADSLFEKSDYLGAIGSYFKASALSTKAPELSRAYFGLAICYFYQRDMAETVKWMRKVALVDPHKTVTVDSYPKPFVDLFNQVLAEARAKGSPVVSTDRVAAAPVQAKESEKIEPVPVPVIVEEEKGENGVPAAAAAAPATNKDEPVLREEPKKPAALNIPQTTAPAYEDFWTKMAGRFEASVHYSSWSVNLVANILEEDINDAFGKALQSAINKELSRRYPTLEKKDFSSDLAFDTSGSNYGFEIRYYSRGRAGTFSLGIGLEKTNIKFAMDGTASQTFTVGGVAQATATALLETKPFATHFSFRWEIGQPTARVKPFITFGIGLAPLDGTFTYSYAGTYTLGSAQESISDSQTKDFAALSEDIDFDIPKTLIILQLDFGLKVEIFNGLFILGEAGIWDGFMLRGGLGYRF
ncbi:MAG: tetratricopeptide repeat protein [Candidatus Aminicenantales bacterium]